MKPNKRSLTTADADDLRARAESRLEELDTSDDEEMTPAEMKRELQLQRIELQLQKEQIQRYERQLEESRERYRDLYFHAPVGYVTLDESGTVGELNYLAAELLGAGRQSIIDTSLFDYVHPDDREHLRDHLDELFDSTGVHHCQIAVELPTDSIVYLEMVSIAVDNPDTGQLQCRSALFDITEQREAARQKDQLEEQLQQSHRLQTLGRLASGIAHDFNNLLTLIIGYSKLAINQLADDHPLANHVRQINKAGHHAGELIEQLLTFSRSDETSSTVIAPNEVIGEMESMFDRLIGDDIRLQARLHDELGVVHFDSAQFQQVLLNLVVNARDAVTDGGHVILRTRNVTLTPEAAAKLDLEAGRHVVVEVEDDGDGIPPEIVPHIFEPFFTTKSSGDNHGCGLSTTYGMVSQHDGAIDVVTEPDGGTTFSVYLPRADQEDDDPEADRQRGRPVVLVVEDQPDLRDFASLVLEELDIEVLSAPSPDEALEQSQACGPELSLVVTDVTMPGLNGSQLLDRIRRVHPDTPVLYISGYDHQSICSEVGIDPEAPFLEKPFSPDELKESVASLLELDPDADSDSPG